MPRVNGTGTDGLPAGNAPEKLATFNVQRSKFKVKDRVEAIHSFDLDKNSDGPRKMVFGGTQGIVGAVQGKNLVVHLFGWHGPITAGREHFRALNPEHRPLNTYPVCS